MKRRRKASSLLFLARFSFNMNKYGVCLREISETGRWTLNMTSDISCSINELLYSHDIISFKPNRKEANSSTGP
ncbi:hypothetical protein QTP86_010987 [Hemibagrus guttatus]|nr:hypothetical protein QTP86_010987 [Hemibagrus guttatus]